MALFKIIGVLSIVVLGQIAAPESHAARRADCPDCRQVVRPDSIKAGFRFDATYFDDADKLELPHRGIDGDLYSLNSIAEEKRAFCSRSSTDIIESLLQKKSPEIDQQRLRRENTIAFDNPPGRFKTFLCWFHTRLQRSFSYLAHYQPNKPKPNRQQIKKIISDMIWMNKVVPIPGYQNTYDFTKENEALIVSAMNDWSERAFVGLQLTQRLTDKPKEDPKKLQERMTELYSRMQRKPQLIFLREKPKNTHLFYSHSALLLSMEPIRNKSDGDNHLSQNAAKGFILKYVDPNSPDAIQEVQYKFGDDGIGRGMLRLDFDNDLDSMIDAIHDYCR